MVLAGSGRISAPAIQWNCPLPPAGRPASSDAPSSAQSGRWLRLGWRLLIARESRGKSRVTRPGRPGSKAEAKADQAIATARQRLAKIDRLAAGIGWLEHIHSSSASRLPISQQPEQTPPAPAPIPAPIGPNIDQPGPRNAAAEPFLQGRGLNLVHVEVPACKPPGRQLHTKSHCTAPTVPTASPVARCKARSGRQGLPWRILLKLPECH